MKRFVALILLVCNACTTLPPEGTPYFARTISGDNLYPATKSWLYATDQLVLSQAPHPLNQDRGETTVSTLPGGFAAGLSAFETFPPPTAADFPIFSPDDAPCCHVAYETQYFYFDGKTIRTTTQAVWRQALGTPPFVD